MRLGTDFKRDASDLQKKVYIFLWESIYFLPKRYTPFYQKIYAFYSEDISFFKKVLWFGGKSTIVLPKKYYRFWEKAYRVAIV